MQLVLPTTCILRKGNTGSAVSVHERLQQSWFGGWTVLSRTRHVTSYCLININLPLQYSD